jgi:ABC-type amino acid transport substrate-binding protein
MVGHLSWAMPHSGAPGITGEVNPWTIRNRRRRAPATTARTGAVVVACLSAALALGACGSGSPASGRFRPKVADTLTVVTSEIPLPGFWEGTAAQPTGGFEYELAVALAQRFGLAHVRVVVVPFAQLVAGDTAGADVALADITATKARRTVLDFTGPYLPATPGVLVRRGTSVPDLKTAQSLTWAVGRSTTLHDYLVDTIQPDAPPILTTARQQVVDAVTSHRVDAGLLDLPVAAAMASASNGRLTVAGQFDKNDDVSAALPKGSHDVDAVDSALRALTADGTIAKLAKQWLGLDIRGGSAQKVPLIRTEG